MSFAMTASKRGSCDRKQVGAVIVQDRRVIATGYNGSVSGLPHCDDVGHDMVDGHCVRTIHAEMNALAQAAKYGVRVGDGSIYTTASPCWACFRVLVNSGIRLFVFAEGYRYGEDQVRIEDVCNETGVIVRRLYTQPQGLIDSAFAAGPEAIAALEAAVIHPCPDCHMLHNGDCDPVDLLGCSDCGIAAGEPCLASCSSKEE